jgi:hypothetical protein
MICLRCCCAGVGADLPQIADLLKLAKERLADRLSDADLRSLRSVASGEIADLSDPEQAKNDPAKSSDWGHSRTVSPAWILWLCTDPDALKLISHRGVHLRGARLQGTVDLEHVAVDFPLTFERCAFTEPLVVRRARLKQLTLSGSLLPAIEAGELVTATSLVLNAGMTVAGRVNLIGAVIHGQLDLTGAVLGSSLASAAKKETKPAGEAPAKDPAAAVAMYADGITVDGLVLMQNGFTSYGELHFVGATMGADWTCGGARFMSPSPTVLIANRARVRGNLELMNISAEGEIDALGTMIDGDLRMTGAKLRSENYTLLADDLHVGRNFLLSAGFQSTGPIRFDRGEIGANLDAREAVLTGKDEYLWQAEMLSVGGDLLAHGLKSAGSIFLRAARVRGDIIFNAAEIARTSDEALFLDAMRIEGDARLGAGFHAQGEVRMIGAKIGGLLSCAGGRFSNPDGDALSLDAIDVGDRVSLEDGFHAQGQVRLLDAKIGRGLDCSGGLFENPQGDALSLERTQVQADIALNGNFKAVGGVLLNDVRVAGDLDCESASFTNPSGEAIEANALGVQGDVYWSSGFHSIGTVRCLGAVIGGDLYTSDGVFEHQPKSRDNSDPDETVLDATGIQVAGDVSLAGRFLGEVRFMDGIVGKNFKCTDGKFLHSADVALQADRIAIKQDAIFRGGFEAAGEVRLVSAQISGNLVCEGAKFANPDGVALNADRISIAASAYLRQGFRIAGKASFFDARINGHLVWLRAPSDAPMTLDLQYAKVGSYYDDVASWPAQGNLSLQGFVYDDINTPTGDAEAEVRDYRHRVAWLLRQGRVPFRPQPFEQLAHAARTDGHLEEARAIAVDMERERASGPCDTWTSWFWLHIFGPLIGYGHLPLRALGYAIGVITLGTLVFDIGFRAGLLSPSDPSRAYSVDEDGNRVLSPDYPRFNPLVYALDVFTPLMSLGLHDCWLPNANRGRRVRIPGKLSRHFGLNRFYICTGGLVRIYFWMHVVAGWILSTLFLAGISGLIVG